MATNLVTRGLGSSHSLVGRGFAASIAAAVEAVIRYGGRRAKDASDQALRFADSVVDVYKITAMLLSVNGSEIIFPESKIVQGSIDRNKEIMVSINNFAVSNVYKPVYKIVIDVLSVSKGIK